MSISQSLAMSLLTSFGLLFSIKTKNLQDILAVFPLNAKKVRFCETMSGGFAVEIQQCVKKVRRFLVSFSVC